MRIARNILPFWCLAGMALASTGCTFTKAIPAGRVPDSLLATPRNNAEPINLIQLRQDPPPVYQLGPRDILGIYIEGILPTSSPENPQTPPVHFPPGGDTAPAVGYPIPVREDGTISLPLIPPIQVSGLTMTQTEDEIRKKYVDEYRILTPENFRAIVTLIRQRTYQVLVVRQDGLGSGEASGTLQRGTARAVDLRAYENDVLHALSLTGGLPGLDAKNEVLILRGAFADATGRESLIRDIEKGNFSGPLPDNPNVIRIPLRILPNEPPPNITEQDIILATGDILYIESRERDVFYTGGLKQGREMLLPRDYDLDVLGAVALVGGTIGNSFSTGRGAGLAGGGFGNGLGLSLPPTEVIILRTTEDGYQVPIKVRLDKALNDPSERILIKRGDVVILEYTPLEMAVNMVVGNINIPLLINYLRN